MDVYVTNDKED
ncbi:hypothetical protein N7504_006267 [Penicillium tannophilum]|nr:hypothetical protein N7504_006267 [Penicillium tannophilum]